VFDGGGEAGASSFLTLQAAYQLLLWVPIALLSLLHNEIIARCRSSL
jgi:hypothetical protein